MPEILTQRWTPLRPHDIQLQLVRTKARFCVVPAGRRSGKTERAKRKLVRAALEETKWPDPRFFAGAPTRDQAKQIYWDDLKRLVPKEFMSGPPRETELSIHLITGGEIRVVGMDKPQRIEGTPWNGGILDEFANMKELAWSENVRPALSDRKGWCWLIGVPEGRNHYYDLYLKALADESGEWQAFTWKSADILDADEIASAKASMDPLSYQQEYEASFLNFTGRTYYAFDRVTHCSKDIAYDPKLPLIFVFDFNVSPGVAAVLQEHVKLPSGHPGTAVIGEVHIPRHSNTQLVCRRLIADWKEHQGSVYLYGDATGGNPGSAKVLGSDWDLVLKELRPVFKDKLINQVSNSNPAERARVNAVNTRLMSVDGTVRLMVNLKTAPMVVKDFEGVCCVEGGSGEIDKKATPMLSHVTDAIGYYINQKFPILKGMVQREF